MEREDVVAGASLDLSVVIPVFNEEGNIKPLYEGLIKTLKALQKTYEIIYVDDGSIDNTFKELEALSKQDHNVKAIRFQRNFKKAAAYSAGFQRAKGKIILTLDGDLQDDPEDIPRLLEKLDEGFDYVSGWKEKKGGPYRAWPSKLFNCIARKITHLHLHDFNCPFKAFRREIVDPFEIYGELHRYIPVLVFKKGYRIGEVKVKNHERLSGASKYGLERFLRGFFDLLTVILLTRYFSSPLYLFGSLGLLLSTIGLGTILILYLLKFFWHIFIQNTPFLFVLGVMSCILGVQFVTFGLLAELMLRLQVRNTQQFVIEKDLNS